MSRSRKQQPPREFELDVTGMCHDGRGVGRIEGKAVFASGALPGERVRVRQTGRNRNFDEGETIEVLQASPDRITPRCAHFGVCAGCVLQHLGQAQQIVAKQRVLEENLARIGHVEPQRVLEPLVDQAWGYRRKGRFSVRYVEKKGRMLIGFRELNPRFVAELTECHTILPELGTRLPELVALLESLEGKRTIPQIEFIAGGGPVALVFRHLEPLSQGDLDLLTDFAKASGFAVFLQPGGVDTVRPLWPESVELSFAIPAFDLELAFRPLDFIQVNAGLNQKMIARAVELLDPQPQDRVLDLFCGLDNVEFHAADLAKDLAAEPWMRGGFDKLLIDPPRAGAAEVLAQLPLAGSRRIVYVSCHPASLARDAGFLVRERGYRLVAAGAMDMFPQTAHVESIAVFEI